MNTRVLARKTGGVFFIFIAVLLSFSLMGTLMRVFSERSKDEDGAYEFAFVLGQLIGCLLILAGIIFLFRKGLKLLRYQKKTNFGIDDHLVDSDSNAQ